MIKLDDEVKDTVTGFKGIAVARIEYLNGCIQFCVKPKVGKDGKLQEGEYIDEGQLILIKRTMKEEIKKRPGGEYMPDCPK